MTDFNEKREVIKKYWPYFERKIEAKTEGGISIVTIFANARDLLWISGNGIYTKQEALHLAKALIEFSELCEAEEITYTESFDEWLSKVPFDTGERYLLWCIGKSNETYENSKRIIERTESDLDEEIKKLKELEESEEIPSSKRGAERKRIESNIYYYKESISIYKSFLESCPDELKRWREKLDYFRKKKSELADVGKTDG